MRSRKIPEGQRKRIKYENSNSNSVGEFKPVGRHSKSNYYNKIC
jgi:hypothetical protein